MSTRQAPAIRRFSSPLLSVDLVCQGPDVVICVSGEMDLSTVHLLDDLVERIALGHPPRVVLDLAGVTFFCADGIRALIGAHDTVTAAGGQLLLRDPSPLTWRILTIAQVEDVFPIDGDTPTATAERTQEAPPAARPTRSLGRVDLYAL